MASVFLRNPDGVIVEQPSEVLAYFLARDWEIVGNPAIVEAEAAALEAAKVADLLKAAAADAADEAAAAAEKAEDVAADSDLPVVEDAPADAETVEDFEDQDDEDDEDEDELLTEGDTDEAVDADDAEVLTTGLGTPTE